MSIIINSIPSEFLMLMQKIAIGLWLWHYCFEIYKKNKGNTGSFDYKRQKVFFLINKKSKLLFRDLLNIDE